MSNNRTFGLHWDHIAAQKLNVDVEEYTIFIISSDMNFVDDKENSKLSLELNTSSEQAASNSENAKQKLILPDNLCLVGMKHIRNRNNHVYGIVNL